MEIIFDILLVVLPALNVLVKYNLCFHAMVCPSLQNNYPVMATGVVKYG
jgi:hypothetical protein